MQNCVSCTQVTNCGLVLRRSLGYYCSASNAQQKVQAQKYCASLQMMEWTQANPPDSYQIPGNCDLQHWNQIDMGTQHDLIFETVPL